MGFRYSKIVPDDQPRHGGHPVAQLVEVDAFGRSRVRFPIESLEFLIDLILPAAMWP